MMVTTTTTTMMMLMNERVSTVIDNTFDDGEACNNLCHTS